MLVGLTKIYYNKSKYQEMFISSPTYFDFLQGRFQKKLFLKYRYLGPCRTLASSIETGGTGC